MLEGRYIWLSRWETNSWVEFSNKKNIWIFASGSKDGWWSGAKKILEKLDSWDISWVSSVTMVSNHAQWGPYQIVNEFKTRFEELWIGLNFHYVDNFPKRWEAWKFSSTDEDIIREIGLGIMRDNHLDYIFLSGWIKQVLWLPMEKVINIHPGPTQDPYGWKGMYGSKVHEKIWDDYQAWIIQRSCVTMHYVTDEVDRGLIICQIPVELDGCTSADDVGRKVNAVEHDWQWKITKMIIDGDISIDKNWIVSYPEDFPYKWKINLSHVN